MKEKNFKITGNTIDPNEIIERFGLDQFRFFLLREVTLGKDGDFSINSFKNRINADLSNNLGNLVQRTLKFLFKNFNGIIPSELDTKELTSNPLKNAYVLSSSVEKLIMNFEINKALDLIFNYISGLNKYMDDSEPWNKIKTNKAEAAEIITQLIEGFRIIGILLQPFLPIAAEKLLNNLNIEKKFREFNNLTTKYVIQKGHKINEPEVPFSKI